MKKRRSTVYVRSGKDVTLYIPSDTPPEVIDYLNQLKRDGYFSQGIMDILIQYVREQRSAIRPPVIPPAETTGSEGVSIPSPWMDDSTNTLPHIDEDRIDLDKPSAVSDNSLAAVESVPLVQTAAAEAKKFSMAQIFRQSRQNSGKLVPTSDHGREPE
ncbi:hypothetical protein ACFPES_27305 [Paenibacillus sp. GCM10023248]|uniref:hypothetical protein n=1 Tax=unclassified Paenibacillus TaxID=185978 RepID=UPI002378F38E|nr:hypothetical protein [Paenibacillus sp. MAHUQ-63]MDD9270772.1 hypothetical protein [Paenibacillus sp. MAHUQ-63]